MVQDSSWFCKSLNLRSLRMPPLTISVCRVYHRSLAIENAGILQHKLDVFVDLTRRGILVLVKLVSDEG